MHRPATRVVNKVKAMGYDAMGKYSEAMVLSIILRLCLLGANIWPGVMACVKLKSPRKPLLAEISATVSHNSME